MCPFKVASDSGGDFVTTSGVRLIQERKKPLLIAAILKAALCRKYTMSLCLRSVYTLFAAPGMLLGIIEDVP